ncbi:MAG: hypothetical protein RIQ72_554 [Candidatus Parcubacteria bacterium]|jgi:uncharacterized LabA/DUF88 family protein
MKTQAQENFAFIDSQNVYLSLKSYGFKIDWKRFRVYLKEHYSVSTAYIFLGYIEGNNDLYSALQQAGFICVFKPVLKYRDGTIKGNVDAEMVLHAMHHIKDYTQAVIVSGDGDFYCLIQYLLKLNKLKTVLVPNKNKYSALLKRFAGKHIAFMNDLVSKISVQK